MNQLEEQLREALRIQAEIKLAKKLYEELDAVIEKLRAGGFSEGEIDGQILRLEDNFADTNTQWRMAAVKRWELKVVKHGGTK